MIKTIKVEVFPAYVTLTTSREVFARRRKRHTDKVIDLHECDGISYSKDCCHLIGVFDGKLSTLVHELGHAAFKILQDCGVPVGVDGNQEAFCHLQQWLFEKLKGDLT